MNRHEATRRVMLTIADPQRHVELLYTAPDGSQPVVVTTPSEHVSDVLTRVDAAGGSASVALAERDGFVVFEMRRMEQEQPVTEPMNPDMSMGMLWIKVRGRKNSQSGFHFDGVDVSTPSAALAYA